MVKILTVYYSRKDENYFNGTVKNIEKGNTEYVAEFIQKTVGGDLFEVEPVKTYPKDYYKCTDEAKKELENKEHVAIKAFKEDLGTYDVIFVGYPNWWGTMPMCMVTFLEHYDLSGKRIIPFYTNEGSGMGNSESDLISICKNAKIEKGLSVHGSEAKNSKLKVYEWAKKFV